MKLKSIHISGFKSFADRTAIAYHDGITGVIGPNGSGKSNIIDALMWVMGEQTAKSLRADDPTDIIFSGSENRKPLGFAEVTLVFTNDGHHVPAEFMHLPEISIGRRIHRSGEREYFMNREPCRLRDIVDFLLSIGLGSKSYAIIQQDRRDRIIQASSEDMREILEETAGISVFKTRRKEAQKRLDSTAERLKSLAELENELVRQKDALSSQVEKAGLKIQYTEELKQKEIELLKNHVGHYTNLAQKTKREIDARNTELAASTQEANAWESQANTLKAEQLELTKQIKSVEDELADCKISLTKFRERSANYKSRQDERAKMRDKLNLELKDEKANLTAEEKRKKELGESLEVTSKELRKFDDVIETHTVKQEEIDESMQVAKSRVEEVRSELRAIENARSALRARNEIILDTTTKLNQSVQKITEKELTHQTAKQAVVADQQSLISELKKISTDLESITLEKSTLEAEMRTVKGEMEAHTQERDSAKENLLKVSSHLSTLQTLVESSAGLTNGSIAFKEKLYSKIKGFMFEHVILDSDDELILEKYLPDFFQSILVENYDTFVDLLDKCEELSLSKVTFLVKDSLPPLSEAEERSIEKISKLRGIHSVGKRIEKLTFKPAQPFFDRIFICQDEWILAKAKKLCEGTEHFIFVTERGTVSYNARHFSFGQTDEQATKVGVLSQKREYARLLKEQESCQQILASKEGVLFQLSQKYRELENKFTEIVSSLEKEKIDSVKMSSELDQFHLQIAHHDADLKRLDEEKQQTLRDIESEKTLFSKNNTQIEDLTTEFKNLEQSFQEFEEKLSERKTLRDELALQIQNIKTQRSVSQERIANLRQNYEEISMQIIKLQAKIDSTYAQIEDLNLQIVNATQEFQELTKEIVNFEQSTHSFESKLNVILANEAEKSDELRTLEHKLKNHKDAAQQKQKFVTEKQIEFARFEAILESAYKDAHDKFNLRIQDLYEEGMDPAIESRDDTSKPRDDARFSAQKRSMLEAIIKDLSQKIAELGAVNERALEEFKDVSTRLDFLVSQKEDIERSIAELNASILEIEETTKVRFKNIFERVNTEFQKLFPILFPGGRGELHMLDEQNLLTTGVEILVQLPGKKTQSMNLFSGGEKALIAISLIFSLLKTTPAPFCFLDEVDAPLDEANVGRFNAIINQLSNEFQFVIITHNRRTMEVLDTIYGISMSEPGVSKLVSVDLNNVPEHLRKNQESAIKAKKVDANLQAEFS